MNINYRKCLSFDDHLFGNKFERENAIETLAALAKDISRAPILSHGLYDGNVGMCLFLFSFSELTQNAELSDTAFYRIKQTFKSTMALQKESSVKSGLLGVDIGLTLFLESNFFEVGLDMFLFLDLLIQPHLYIDNILDFSVSKGMPGYGLYRISKLNSSLRLNPILKLREAEELKKIIGYSELSFNYTLKHEKTQDNVDLYMDKIEHSYIPLLCWSKSAFLNENEFITKIESASRQLINYYNNTTRVVTLKTYEKLLFANSLYIASTYLNDDELKREAYRIVESTIKAGLQNDINNLSLGNGLAGIMYLCVRFYCFENLPLLLDAIDQMFKIILADMQKSTANRALKDVDHSLCLGTSGTAMVMLAIISGKKHGLDLLLALGEPNPGL